MQNLYFNKYLLRLDSIYKFKLKSIINKELELHIFLNINSMYTYLKNQLKNQEIINIFFYFFLFLIFQEIPKIRKINEFIIELNKKDYNYISEFFFKLNVEYYNIYKNIIFNKNFLHILKSNILDLYTMDKYCNLIFKQYKTNFPTIEYTLNR